MRDRLRTAALLGLCAIASLLTAANSDASECGQRWAGGSPVPGTLASPSSPCPPGSNTAPAPQPQRSGRPGTFQHGNTTISVGGSISTEVGVGGGRGR